MADPTISFRHDVSAMRPAPRMSPGRLFALLAGVLVVKVTASVVANYRNYWPPNFASDFLRGREAYFPGAYQWQFSEHRLWMWRCYLLLCSASSTTSARLPLGDSGRGRADDPADLRWTHPAWNEIRNLGERGNLHDIVEPSAGR